MDYLKREMKSVNEELLTPRKGGGGKKDERASKQALEISQSDTQSSLNGDVNSLIS